MNQNILYLDDEKNNLNVFYVSFMERYNIFLAQNKIEALKILEENEIKVIISDQRMPDTTGLDFIKEVNVINLNIVCIILTAYPDNDLLLLALNQAKVFRFMVKPWVEFDVIQTLNKAIETYDAKIEKIKLLSDLRTALKKSEESDKLKSSFLANLSHEIRTPLNGIVGFSTLIGEKDNSMSEYVSIIKESSDRLIEVVESIVEISNIETGCLEHNYSEFLLEEFIQSVYNTCKQKFTNSNVELSLETSDFDNEFIYTDKQKLHQVFHHIVDNAFKFTTSGKITIGFTVVENNELLFFVTDTGQGIPDNELSNIIKPFCQGKTDTSIGRASGNGIGLSIANGYVKFLGGLLSVNSIVGEGTTVQFTINTSTTTNNKLNHSITTIDPPEQELLSPDEYNTKFDKELNLIFNNLPITTLLVNEKGKVIKINNNNKNFINTDKNTKPLPGNLLHCINTLGGEEECGMHKLCKHCILRNTFEDTLTTGKKHHKVEGTLKLNINGELKEVTVLISTSLIPHTKEKLVLVSIDDITKQKESLKTLEESNKNFKELIFNYPIPYQSLNKKGEYINTNKELLNLLGYTNKEVIGKKFSDFWRTSDQNLFLDKFAYFLENNEVKTELNLKTKKGKDITVVLEGKVQRNTKGDFIGTHCVLHNITERKIIETKLKQSEEEYKLIANSISDLVWKADLNLNFTYISPSVYKTRGLTVKEALSEKLKDKFTPESLKLAKKTLHTKLEQIKLGDHKGWEPVIQDFQLYKKDKTILWVQASTRLIKGNDGKPSEIIGVARDISEQKKYKESLIESKKTLEKQNREKDKYISVLSHDLINTLGGNINILDMLRKNGPNWDKSQEFIGYLDENTRSAFQLLKNLTTWGKASLGKQPFKPKKIIVHSIVNGVFNLFKSQLKQKQISLINSCNPSQMVYADAFMMESIFRNIIMNAIKYTHPNGTIVVKSEQTDDLVSISVSDNGVGMEQAKAEKLFSFENIKSEPDTEGEKGTGLGLQIVKEYVDMHSGNIWAESELKKGTKVFFTIPLL